MFIRRLGDDSIPDVTDVTSMMPMMSSDISPTLYLIGGMVLLATALWWGGAAKKTVSKVRGFGKRRRARARRKKELQEELASL